MHTLIRATVSQREIAILSLMLVSEMRGLEDTFNQVWKTLPESFRGDVMQFEFVRESRREAVKELVCKQLTKRFGHLPSSIIERLNLLSDAQNSQMAVDLLDARSLADLFGDS